MGSAVGYPMRTLCSVLIGPYKYLRYMFTTRYSPSRFELFLHGATRRLSSLKVGRVDLSLVVACRMERSHDSAVPHIPCRNCGVIVDGGGETSDLQRFLLMGLFEQVQIFKLVGAWNLSFVRRSQDEGVVHGAASRFVV